MEEFHAKPLNERKSQHLGPVDYVKDNAWSLLPLASVIAGVGIGAATKHKFFPFNGHLPITTQAEEWLWRKVFAKGGMNVEFNNTNRLFNIFSEETAEKIAPHIWNGIKAAEFSTLPSLYLWWRKKEAQRLELKDVSQKFLDLPTDIKPTDAELAAENDSLRRQLAFVREQNASPATRLSAVDAEHSGTVTEPQQQAMAK